MILLTVMMTTRLLVAQNPPPQPAVSDILKTVDQLVEQNRRLEEQNQGLIKEINILRQVLQKQVGQPPQEVPRASSSTGTASSPALAKTMQQRRPATVRKMTSRRHFQKLRTDSLVY